MKKLFIPLLINFLTSVALFAQITSIQDNVSFFGGLQVGNKVVFATGTAQLALTDGSASGTLFIPSSKVILDFANLAAGNMGSRFFFTGINSTNGSELWVTDGTETGTKMVKDIFPGSTGSSIKAPNDHGNFPAVNNSIYFVANDGTHGNQLWISAGTTDGTHLVKVIRAGADPNIKFPETADSNFFAGNTFYFVANDGVNGQELWKTNGTEASTSLVADISPGLASTGFGPSFISLCGTLLFQADNGVHGMEMWRTNGTGPGTYLLKDIAPGLASAFSNDENRINSFTFHNRVYFTAFEGGAENHNNEQLWVSDGTPAGTLRMTNLNQMYGGFHADLSNNSRAVIKGSHFYFFVYGYGEIQSSMWQSDGTSYGTQMVRAINDVPPVWGPDYRYPQVRILLPVVGFSDGDVAQSLFKGDQFFFIADDGVHKAQLWISDGTDGGTKMLTINPTGDGVDTTDHYKDFYYRLTASHLYFTGVEALHGCELWKSDGTQPGTVMVNDTRPGAASSATQLYGIANANLVFTANNGSQTNLYRLNQLVSGYESGSSVILCPNGGASLNSDVNGASYQWQVNTPSGWINPPEGEYFTGVNSPVLILSNIPSQWYGAEFRCLVDGSQFSRSFRLQFLAFWVGAVSNAWENPANWQCGGVPDANTDVLMQCSFGNPPVINSNAVCRRIWLLNGQSLQIAPGYKLTITKED